MQVNLGKILISPKGAYSAAVAYKYLDIVRSGTSIYMCNNVAGAPAGTAVTNTTYFMLLNADGVTGDTGAAGTPAYFHVRWGATATPGTLLTTPDLYIGVVSSSSPTAPATYAGYSWYLWKGTKGDTGLKGDAGDTGLTGATGPEGQSVTAAEINVAGELVLTIDTRV